MTDIIYRTGPNAYENCSVGDQLRINAVIVEQFRTNPDFIRSFQERGRQLNPSNPREGYQMLLDGMRDALAYDVTRLPKVNNNGKDDATDLRHMRYAILTPILDLMGQERGTPSAPINPPERYMGIVERNAQIIDSNNPGTVFIPRPENRLNGENLVRGGYARAVQDNHLSGARADNTGLPRIPGVSGPETGRG